MRERLLGIVFPGSANVRLNIAFKSDAPDQDAGQRLLLALLNAYGFGQTELDRCKAKVSDVVAFDSYSIDCTTNGRAGLAYDIKIIPN